MSLSFAGDYQTIIIGDSAFSNCTKLNSFSLDGGSLNRVYASEIGKNAFSRCTSLEKLVIYECEGIYAGAFEGCTNLKTLIIVTNRLNMDITSLVNTGIADNNGYPTGDGFVYVSSSIYENVIANITEQAAAILGDATVAEQMARLILRKIEDYPEIFG